jgi:MFS family permease
MIRLLEKLIPYLFRVQDTLSEKESLRGIRLLKLDGVAGISMITLQGGPFLVAFAVALGATNYEVGLLMTIALVSQFMQIPGLYLLKKVKRRRLVAVSALTVSRLSWVFIIAIPFLFLDRGITFLLHWLIFISLVGALAAPAWNSWVRDLVPEDRLGAVFSRRMYWSTIFALILTLSGGYFVDWWGKNHPEAPLYAYSMVFSLGLVFGIIGLAALTMMPETEMVVDEDMPASGLLAKPLQDGNFRSLVYFIMIWNFAINLAAPFFVIYMLKRIELSIFTITALSVLSYLTNIVFLRIWGRFADTYSNKSVLAVSGPLFLLVILGWSFTTMPERHMFTIPILIIIHILSGMSLSGVSLASVNIALKLSPRGYAHVYTAVYGMAGAATGAMAPLFGGVFADFFSVRELAITVSWFEPGREFSVYALNFKALDFLFVFAFLVGLVSIAQLAKVREAGDVDHDEIREQLLAEVVGPFRSFSAMAGVRHLVTIPFSAMHRLIKR